MKSRFFARLPLVVGGMLGILLLSGCQNQKVVARVKNQPITEEQLSARAMRLTANDLQAYPSLDSGAAALVSIIREKLSDIYCAEKGWQPTTAEVDKWVAYLRHRNPALDAAIKAGKIDIEDLKRDNKFLMEEVAIGTDGAKVDAAELQKEYDSNKPALSIPKFYVLRLLPVPDAATAEKILPELKNSGDFRTAAAKLGMPPAQAMGAGQESYAAATAFEADTVAELDNIAKSTSKFTDKPLPLKIKASPENPQPGAQLVIGQVTSVIPEFVPTPDEVKFVLTQRILARKFPNFELHKNQMIAEYTGNANIQINVKRYEPLLDIFRLQAQLNATPQPGTSAAPNGAAPSGTTGAPSASGGTAAPSSSGTTPNSSAPAPSGASGSVPAPSGSGK